MCEEEVVGGLYKSVVECCYNVFYGDVGVGICGIFGFFVMGRCRWRRRGRRWWWGFYESGGKVEVESEIRVFRVFRV